ncbi:MAG TPA: GlxA family transcriptional regulator [Bacteroidota bacterium]|nr:GlxA family transcriptional regulator [Bacteroidota bacterium]
MKRRRVGLLGYDGVMALDVAGPADAFTSVMEDSGEGTRTPSYDVMILGLGKGPFSTESGLLFRPHMSLSDAPQIDTLIVPGGMGLRRPATQAAVARWVKSHHARIRRIASVCTGIYGIAPTGLLDGRHVTTHWRHAKDLAAKFPRLIVEPDALYLRDGGFYTCAGVTAGIDLALALIEEDHGPKAALEVARELVVYLKRDGGQEQYSEPLQYQTQSADRFSDLVAWVSSHMEEDLSVDTLAGRTHLCVRHFSRRFKKTFGTSPATFVEEIRLAEARRRLATQSRSIDEIAGSVGFRSADAFRRAFERRFGIPPGRYRQNFSPRAE